MEINFTILKINFVVIKIRSIFAVDKNSKTDTMDVLTITSTDAWDLLNDRVRCLKKYKTYRVDESTMHSSVPDHQKDKHISEIHFGENLCAIYAPSGIMTEIAYDIVSHMPDGDRLAISLGVAERNYPDAPAPYIADIKIEIDIERGEFDDSYVAALLAEIYPNPNWGPSRLKVRDTPTIVIEASKIILTVTEEYFKESYGRLVAVAKNYEEDVITYRPTRIFTAAQFVKDNKEAATALVQSANAMSIVYLGRYVMYRSESSPDTALRRVAAAIQENTAGRTDYYRILYGIMDDLLKLLEEYPESHGLLVSQGLDVEQEKAAILESTYPF